MKEIINSHDDLISQITGKDFYTLLLSIDEMVNSVSPMDIYKKYEPLYLKLSNPRKEPQIKTHLFF